MPILCQKNIHTHKNKLLSYNFYQFFYKKLPAFIPIFGQKNANSVKITHYDQESEKDVLFFGFFTKKICSNAHIFSKKKRQFSKKTLLSCPYFVEKTSILSETLCSYVNFFKIFIKNPLLSCPYLIKNINSIKTTL